jgi:hypothetical protein
MGDRILPFYQLPIADELTASIEPVYEYNISPAFHSFNQILTDFQGLGDRSNSNAQLFRWLDATE